MAAVEATEGREEFLSLAFEIPLLQISSSKNTEKCSFPGIQRKLYILAFLAAFQEKKRETFLPLSLLREAHYQKLLREETVHVTAAADK